ncbi:MAG: FkbM family methyltransferase [Thermodesulfobacteriota bacterium]|nr:FkbM family methyltransferase [Thermodesulfobacteriota bacterium]
MDLSEGIDLSLFLFGTFQKNISRPRYFVFPEQAIVMDVGANIGAMTLPYAIQVPIGHVYAFEPDPLAYEKLVKNISINPQLCGRITADRVFVSDRTLDTPVERDVYASWKLTGREAGRHRLHGGIRKTIFMVPQVTLDDYCRKNAIAHVDLIKIDTDGHEFFVLKGATWILKTFRPVIIFEAGLYALAENRVDLNEMVGFLCDLGYKLLNSRNGKHIKTFNCHKQIPISHTTDIIAIPANGPIRPY